MKKFLEKLIGYLKNKLFSFTNADPNFGMLNEHLEITEYLILKKKETGYPQKTQS